MTLIPEYSAGRKDNIESQIYRDLRSAVFCGAAPLALGMGVFIRWLQTRESKYTILGILVVFGGLLCFFVGATLLTRAYLSRRRHYVISSRTPTPSEWLIALLLLSNFPACGTLLVSVDRLKNEASVTIQNVGVTSVDRLSVSSDFGTYEVGPIRPGTSKTCNFPWSGGILYFTRTTNGKTVTGIVSGTERAIVDDDSPFDFRTGGVKLRVSDSGMDGPL